MEIYDWLELVGIVIVAVLAVIFCLGFTIRRNSFVCKNKWSSFESRFTSAGGCQIKLNDKWIPSDSYYYKEGK